MALNIGHMHRLRVLEVGPQSLRLSDGDSEVPLPKREAPTGVVVGDELDVFVYTDPAGAPLATTKRPLACVGEIVPLTVTALTPTGAFLDWGLGKELLVPFAEQEQPLQVGETLLIAVRLHARTQRVVGTTRFARSFNADVSGFRVGQPVSIVPYRQTELGVQVVVERRAAGLVYNSDVYGELHPMKELRGYVRGVRPDGKLDIALKPTGSAGRDRDADAIMRALDAAGGYLPLHDKSSPEEIERVVQLSKKSFKRALGNLYRARRVVLTDDGVRRAKAE